MMSNIKIALIAEDDTDCDAIRKIVHRVLGEDVTTKKWASKGCNTLKKKLTSKIKLLSNEGCSIFIIVHDLDRNPQNDSLNNEPVLRSKLESLSSGVESFNKHICIPIEELELGSGLIQKLSNILVVKKRKHILTLTKLKVQKKN